MMISDYEMVNSDGKNVKRLLMCQLLTMWIFYAFIIGVVLYIINDYNLKTIPISASNMAEHLERLTQIFEEAEECIKASGVCST